MTASLRTTIRAHILRIDSAAGLAAGLFMLTLSSVLSAWYALPRPLVLGMGVANVVYGSYSGWLARRVRRAQGMVSALAIANGVWACLCVAAAVYFAGSASLLGLGTLVFEGVFVGTLAVLEWRWRKELVR